MKGQNSITLTSNGRTATLMLESNQATRQLVELLEAGPLTLSMSENGGFEKIGYLPQRLPTSDVRQTAVSGDVMLYTGNVLCIFYGSNTWAYTKIGRISGMSSSEIREFLSGNPVNVTLSLPADTYVSETGTDVADTRKVYDLSGKLVTQRPLRPAVYIIDGKKYLVRETSK